MSSKTSFLPIALLALILSGGSVAQTAAGSQDQGPHPFHGRHKIARRTVPGRIEARGELRRFLESLQVTDAQRAVALEEARAADPIARAARVDAAKIRAKARRDHRGDRDAAREEVANKIKDLRQRTLEQLRPLAQRVLSTLTPEQRTKLAEAAQKRGKTLDQDRLEKITSWLLTRPRTVHRLERRLAR